MFHRAHKARKVILITIVITAVVITFIWNHLIAPVRESENTSTLVAGRDEAHDNMACVDPLATDFGRVEDIFCKNLPPFLSHLKNPCFFEKGKGLKNVIQCLPYFNLIGMDKSATTDLHNRISLHPAIRVNGGSNGKETGFWSWTRYGVSNYYDDHRREQLKDYLKYFSIISKEIQNGTRDSRNIITGDATPMDLWDFRYWNLIPQNFGRRSPLILTPNLIKYIYKDNVPKMLVQLREPVERLYSDYIFLFHGSNTTSFHHHVVEAISIMKDCFNKTEDERMCFFDKNIYRKLPTRIHLGCYSVFLKEWLQVFPLSAFHVTRTEDYHQNMNETLTGIFSFLQLEPPSEEELSHIISKDNKHVTKQKKGKILLKTFDILREFYLPYIKETASLLKDKRFLWEDVYDRLDLERRESEKGLDGSSTVQH